MPATVEVVVVGAGPYGLALAAHLRHRRVDFCVVGRPMESWDARMPDGMFLKSEGFASNIAHPQGENTLAEFCRESGEEYADCGVPVPIEAFRRYGRWVLERGDFPRAAALVTEIRRAPGGFRVGLDTGEELDTRAVVVATGITRFEHVPVQLSSLGQGSVLHTSDAVDIGTLAQEDTVIVGAGQSALELAALLLERGATPRVLVRRRDVRWNPEPRLARTRAERLRAPRGPLGEGWKLLAYADAAGLFRHLPHATRTRIVRETLGPSGAWWLRERVEPHGVVRLDHRVESAQASGGGTGAMVTMRVVTGGAPAELTARRIVAATGYRVDVGKLPFLHPELVAQIACRDGAPMLSRSFESSLPGLFFVGLAAASTFGPVMRFVCGSGLAADRVSRVLA